MSSDRLSDFSGSTLKKAGYVQDRAKFFEMKSSNENMGSQRSRPPIAKPKGGSLQEPKAAPKPEGTMDSINSTGTTTTQGSNKKSLLTVSQMALKYVSTTKSSSPASCMSANQTITSIAPAYDTAVNSDLCQRPLSQKRTTLAEESEPQLSSYEDQLKSSLPVNRISQPQTKQAEEMVQLSPHAH